MATCKNYDGGSDQISQLCGFCDTNISDGYCKECASYMCQPCFDLHIRGKTCRDHVLLDDACSDGNNKSNTKPCTRHPNMVIKFYCVGHEMVGCVECFFPDHRKCHYQNIVDAAKTFKDSGEEAYLKREIRRLDNEHIKSTEQCERDKETAVVINNKTVEDVKSFKDSVTSYVAKFEELALEKSEKLRIENETRLEKRLSELGGVGEDIELCMVTLENQDHAETLFITAVEMKPEIERLGQTMSSLGCQSVVTKYEFQPNKLITEIIHEPHSFGDVRILPEPGTVQPGENVDCSIVVLEDSGHLEAIPKQDIVEPTNSLPEGNRNVIKGAEKNHREEEIGNVPVEIKPKGPPIERKILFQLKPFMPARGGNFYFIKSDACAKPFKYTPKYGEVSLDEDDDTLYDGDHCFTICIKDGTIVLDEIFEAVITNKTPSK